MNSKVLKFFLPMAICITYSALMIFFVGQKLIRENANNPQLQISREMAGALTGDIDVAQKFFSVQVNYKKSSLPFFMNFSETGKLLASNGIYGEKVELPPQDIMEYAKSRSDYRFTWKLPGGTKVAAVTNRYEGKEPGFVLVARNLTENEQANKELTKLVFIGLLAGYIAAFGASYYLTKKHRD